MSASRRAVGTGNATRWGPERPHRWRRLIASVSVLALTAGACGGEDDATEQGATTTERPTPAAVQELVVGYAADPWIDASQEDKKRFPNYPLNADVCETLVQLSPDFQSVPSLATKAELAGDNKFRFTLRDDVTFSDGTKMTAKDVKFSLDYTAAAPPTSGFAFLGPESTVVIDDRTVEVTPTKPNLRLVEQINHPTYAVLGPGSDPLANPKPLCTGPFKVTEYVPDERLVVERNDNYWGKKATLSKITFRFIPDDTTRTLALQNGEVDLITNVPRSIVSTFEGAPGIKLVNAPVGQVTLMYLSRRDSAGSDRILADPVVRRAVAHAIDRKEFVEGVLDGNAKVVTTVNPPEVLGKYANLVKGVPHDPNEATRILEQGGWTAGGGGVRSKNGRPLELSIILSSGAGGTGVDLGTAEFVQAKLRAVGIGAKIEQLDPGAYRERLDNGTYDIDISGPNQNDANPAFLLSLRWYSKATGKNAKWISPGPDTKFESLIDQTQKSTDPDELQRLAAEAMHELVDVEVAGIPLAGVYRIYAMKEKVQGLKPHPSGTNQRWSTVFISK